MFDKVKILICLMCGLASCHADKPAPPFPVLSDIFKAMPIAEQQQRNILILYDWTGSAVDAIEMLRLPEIAPIIQENYVFVHVFADDLKTWDDGKTFTDRFGFKIDRVGSYYRDMQIRFFGDDFQPMYALLNAHAKPLRHAGKPLFEGYLSAKDAQKVARFKQFLEKGIQKGFSN